MTASEKLKALDELGGLEGLGAVIEVLPQLIAVVEAAEAATRQNAVEAPYVAQTRSNEIGVALSALDEALT